MDNQADEKSAALNELVRTTVLSEIKRRRRRINMREAAALFPSMDDDILEELRKLETRGLIAVSWEHADEGGYSGSQSRGQSAGGAFVSGDAIGTAGAVAGDFLTRIGGVLREAGILVGGSGRGVREDDTVFMQRYREKTQNNAEKEMTAFRSHAATYALVNTGLAVISLLFTPGMPWFLFPLFGWGIGLASHAVTCKRKNDAVTHLAAVPRLQRKDLPLVQEYERVRTSFSSHAVSTVGVIGLLGVINAVTTPGFPWALIPSVFLSLSVFVHGVGYKVSVHGIRQRMRRAGIALPKLPLFRPRRRIQSEKMNYARRIDHAKVIRRAMRSQYRKTRKMRDALGRDFLPQLDHYVNQIDEMEQRSSEVLSIINSIPVNELTRDMASLQQRKNESDDARMIQQYDHSIQQIQQQQESCRRLVQQQELLDLRLDAAMNSLKQLQIDMLRLDSLTDGRDVSLAKELHDRSEDLSLYLRDVEASLSEL